MKTTLLNIENKFSNHYKELLTIQENIFQELLAYPFDLEQDEITLAVLERMDAFWYFHVNNTKNILQGNINPTAADFFTETCHLYLKAYFQSKHGLIVKSEFSIVSGKNSVRPDISIWQGDRLIAAIELKVNDGWKRKSIHDHLIGREAQIKSIHPNSYFGVIAFWNFFDTSLPDWNQKYISLLTWDEKKHHPRTGGRIENLIRNIEEHLVKIQN